MKLVRTLAALLAAVTWSLPAGAEPVLRYALFESMAYPYTVYDARQRLAGGLLRDLGEALAEELDMTLKPMSLPRRRIEPALLAGDADLVCYHSPQWSDAADKLLWSAPTLAQVERVVAPVGLRLSGDFERDLVGKRVALQLGYHYPLLDPLIADGRLRRIDETGVARMFKAVSMGMADLLITSEGEIVGHFHGDPAARARFAVSEQVFSTVRTQCALSPRSALGLERLDKAIAALKAKGSLQRLAQQYGLSP